MSKVTVGNHSIHLYTLSLSLRDILEAISYIQFIGHQLALSRRLCCHKTLMRSTLWRQAYQLMSADVYARE